LSFVRQLRDGTPPELTSDDRGSFDDVALLGVEPVKPGAEEGLEGGWNGEF
jgi:hypothetical protein